MSKKYKLLLLFLTGLFLLSSCREMPKSANDSNVDAPQTDESTESTDPDVIGDSWFNPIFSTGTSNEYRAFLQSKDCSVMLFSLDTFACFGTFSHFEAYNATSISNLSVAYLYRFDKIDTWIRVARRDDGDYSTHYGEIYIEEGDVPDNFYKNPVRHWMELSNDDESIYWAYVQKYSIGSDDKYIHFKINDNIILRWHGGAYSIPEIVFLFDNYVMETSFSLEIAIQEGGELICTNPTIRALLTKSTSKAAAEELYNLWKDALK